MAAMRPLKALSLLGLSPVLAASTLSGSCRNPTQTLTRELAAQQCSAYSTSATSKSFSFRIAASYSGKGNRFEPRKDLFQFHPHSGAAAAGRSPRENRPNTGQDAFFVGDVGGGAGGDDVAFGVADGVGGWQESGIDPADFSHGLCEYMRMAAAAGGKLQEEVEEGEGPKDAAAADGRVRPKELLQVAFEATTHDGDIYAGGSTACVAVGRGDGTLEVANLGDSGFVQLRPNAVHFASEAQTHAFNTPYQLSLVPPAILARQRAFGGEPLMDSPANASVTVHRVRHGDVFVFGSDGLWDNLSPSDVLGVVTEYMVGFGGWRMDFPTKADPNAPLGTEAMIIAPALGRIAEDGGIGTFERTIQALLAVAIAGEAKIASLNQKRDGPFAREIKRYYPNEDWHGGKVDDICVIVAVVVGKDR